MPYQANNEGGVNISPELPSLRALIGGESREGPYKLRLAQPSRVSGASVTFALSNSTREGPNKHIRPLKHPNFFPTRKHSPRSHYTSLSTQFNRKT